MNMLQGELREGLGAGRSGQGHTDVQEQMGKCHQQHPEVPGTA